MDAEATMRGRPLSRKSQLHWNDTCGINIPEDALQQLRKIREELQEKDRVTIYSDGSMKETGTPDVSMAFGVIIQEDVVTYSTAITGRVAGYASSTKAELAGLFAAILASPRHTPVTIYIDNSAVVTQFKTLVQARQDCTERQRLRTPYAAWWAAVSNAYQHQGKNIKVEWVKGHAGNHGNIAADKAANLGHNESQWDLKDKEHNDILCHARFKNVAVEDDLRRLLKRQSATRINSQWREQNRVKDNIKNWETVDWKATLHIVHNGNTPRGLFTSTAD
ncbi:hypothetical protein BGX26_007471, partial [Mortierella sp. AD094]